MYSIPESAAPPRPYNTAPNAQRGAYSNGPGRVDEFGYSGAATAGYGRPPQSAQTVGSRPNGQAAIGRPIDPRRPGSMAANQRFTVTNFDEMDLPRDDDSEGHGQGSSSVQARAPPSPPKQQNQQWLSAEEEKRRLYESARAKVERVQGGVLSDRSDVSNAASRSIFFSKLKMVSSLLQLRRRRAPLQGSRVGLLRSKRKPGCSNRPKLLRNKPRATALIHRRQLPTPESLAVSRVQEVYRPTCLREPLCIRKQCPPYQGTPRQAAFHRRLRGHLRLWPQYLSIALQRKRRQR